MKQNEWDNEWHNEHVPNKMITIQTSWNSKRTPTGGQKPMEQVGWWTTWQTHSLVTMTWASWNLKRTPTGGHEPLEQAGQQMTWGTCSQCDKNPHRRAWTSRTEMMTIQTSQNSKRTSQTLPTCSPTPSVNIIFSISGSRFGLLVQVQPFAQTQIKNPRFRFRFKLGLRGLWTGPWPVYDWEYTREFSSRSLTEGAMVCNLMVRWGLSGMEKL